uniref:ATPase 8 n=1 Tax=Cepaea hortensis TaxID=97200 RepID=Q5EJV5_9EUPU|nr:ATPase 8 [Cepaea hortensis]
MLPQLSPHTLTTLVLAMAAMITLLLISMNTRSPHLKQVEAPIKLLSSHVIYFFYSGSQCVSFKN